MNIIDNITSFFRFLNDRKTYRKLLNSSDEDFQICPQNCMRIYEKGNMNPDIHYFLQDYYMAKKVINACPSNHYDIGSRVDGFIMHLLSAGVKCTMLDIRPLDITVEGLEFIQADATNLETIPDNSVLSISSLHAIEHFGLGRYGDPIDPYAWKKVLIAIEKKLQVGGQFYLGVPIANKSKLFFNAHRVFAPSLIISSVQGLKLKSFAFVHDYKIVEPVFSDLGKLDSQIGDYDCGLFVFEK